MTHFWGTGGYLTCTSAIQCTLHCVVVQHDSKYTPTHGHDVPVHDRMLVCTATHRLHISSTTICGHNTHSSFFDITARVLLSLCCCHGIADTTEHRRLFCTQLAKCIVLLWTCLLGTCSLCICTPTLPYSGLTSLHYFIAFESPALVQLQ